MTALHATTSRNRNQGRDALPSYTVDQLAAMPLDQLEAVYRAGRLPASLHDLDGAPAGRMLTLAGPLGRGAIADGLRRFARSPVFPWAGKSFHATADDAGSGINRVRLGVTRAWFPFETRIEPSAIDGEPCVVLDYDKSVNPWFIRAIHDELREVSPGVFLGPAMAKVRGGKKLVLFFAIDKR